MMKKPIKSRRGEGYVDMCVGVVVFVMILVLAINFFSFISIRLDMDQIADELLQTATYSGCFGDDLSDRSETLAEQYGIDFYTEYSAEKYFNATYKKVQLGKTMFVSVYVDTYIKGIGIFKIPVTLTVTRSGLSQKYWK